MEFGQVGRGLLKAELYDGLFVDFGDAYKGLGFYLGRAVLDNSSVVAARRGGT